jgi:hypothetical protein
MKPGCAAADVRDVVDVVPVPEAFEVPVVVDEAGVVAVVDGGVVVDFPDEPEELDVVDVVADELEPPPPQAARSNPPATAIVARP